MLTVNESLVVEKMKRTIPEFERDGSFTRAELILVSEGLGLTPQWSLIAKSNRVGRGQYQYSDSGKVSMVISKESPKKPKKAKVVATPEPEMVAEVNFEAPKVGPMTFAQPSVRPAVAVVVPPVNDKYVPFGNYRDIEKIIKSRAFFPLLITGHSGNGKSTTITQIHAKNKLPLIRLNITKKTDEETLIGSKTLINGNVVIVEGPIITAMRNGCTVLLDEIDAAETNSIMCLQTIMEGAPYYFAALGEYVTPAPGFNLVMTANTKGQGSEDGRYIGTQILNEAFLERIAFTFEQEYPSPAVEKKIVMNIMKSLDVEDEKFAEELVKWADAIRRSFGDGAVDNLIATRRLEHVVRGYSIFRDKRKCVELAVNRFDAMTKQAFVELFDKIATDQTPVAEEIVSAQKASA